VGKGERSYHIFYQLVSALNDASVREELGLHHSAEEFRMLAQGECFATADDVAEFDLTMNALRKLKFSEERIASIMKLLSTCLHLGNLDFACDEMKNDTVIISCATASLDFIANTLGLDYSLLRTALITQKLVVRGRSSLKVKILSVDEVANNANALLKFLYSKLFEWIVSKINECHSSFYNSASTIHFVGILDIFGFEILRSNSFEQLCINYTNERLQQQFNQHVFVSEQEMYRSEGLEWENVSFQDNQPVIDLISNVKKPLGLLQLLEEQGLLNRKPDDNALIFSFNNQHEQKDPKSRDSAIYWKSKFGNNAFVVKHFAGEVTYIVDGFLIKNNNSLQDDLLSTLNLSEDVFIREILGFPIIAAKVAKSSAADDASGELDDTVLTPSAIKKSAEAVSGKKMASASTVSSHFRNQLDDLMNTLYCTRPHYIKCIKSNSKKQAGLFEAQLITQQLRYSGVLEVVRIRREGFPVQMTYKDFVRKYRILLKGSSPEVYFLDLDSLSNIDCKPFCHDIISASSAFYHIQVGNSMVFLRDRGKDAMQIAIHNFLEKKAVIIQSKYKSMLIRKHFILKLKMTLVVKRFLKMSVPRRKFLIRLQAIRAIQRFYFYRIRRKRLLADQKVKNAAVCIQSNFRRSIVQRRFKWIVRRIISFQTKYRRFIARKMFVVMHFAAILIQSSIRRQLYKWKFASFKRSAILLQSVARRFALQKVFRVNKSATLKLQTTVRKLLSRRRFIQSLRHIVLLQSLIRSYLTRFKFVRAKACAIMIQTNYRLFQAHKKFIILKRATMVLQTWYRCHHQRKQFSRMQRSSLLLSSVIRLFIARSHYRRQIRALRRIQLAANAFLRNTRLRRRLTALHNPDVSPEFLRSYLKSSPEDANHLHKCEEVGQSKPVLRRLIHSVLLGPHVDLSAVAIKDVLKTTYKDLMEVDSLGRNSFHYLAINPFLEIAKLLASILNSYEFETLDAMEGLDEDEADAVDNARIARIKNSVAESISNTKLLEGWLKKKRGGFMWQRRWIVLSEDYIVYYNSNTVSTKDPKFAIPLEGCTVQRVPGTREPIFEIFAPNMSSKRTFFGSSTKKSMTFLCESEEDLQRWLIPLRAMSGVDTLRTSSVSYVKLELYQLLLNSEDKSGNSPLHCLIAAASTKSFDEQSINQCLNVLCWFIENGSLVSHQNRDGNTPLHLALQHRLHPLLVKCLLLKGADTKTKRNADGKTTMELYRSNSDCQDLYGDYFGDFAGSRPVEFPLKMKGYSYFSVFVESQSFEKPQASISNHPVLTFSAFNSKRQLIEAPKDLKEPAMVSSAAGEKNITWGSMWHMNTPLENLQEDSYVLIEYKVKVDGPVVSSVQISLDRQSVDSMATKLHLAVPTDGGRQANPILALKENSTLNVETILTKKPKLISMDHLVK
jgi:myosin-5